MATTPKSYVSLAESGELKNNDNHIPNVSMGSRTASPTPSEDVLPYGHQYSHSIAIPSTTNLNRINRLLHDSAKGKQTKRKQTKRKPTKHKPTKRNPIKRKPTKRKPRKSKPKKRTKRRRNKQARGS